MSEPKFAIGERVMVRADAFKSDDAGIIEQRLFPASSVFRKLGTGEMRYLEQDYWYYRFDCNNIGPNGSLPWTHEKDVFPKHDGGSSFQDIMNSLKQPIKQPETGE